MSPSLKNIIIKQAQSDLRISEYLANMRNIEPAVIKPKRSAPKRKKRLLPEAYPDYGRSLVSQERSSPLMAGILRALKYGGIAGVTGATGSAVLGDKENAARNALIGGILSSLLVGIPAYSSGKKEQESENSRLLFLRRMGIDSPGEYEAMSKYPELTSILSERGRRI